MLNALTAIYLSEFAIGLYIGLGVGLVGMTCLYRRGLALLRVCDRSGGQ